MDGPLIIIIIIIIITTIIIIIKLMGGGREKYEKKIFAQGKIKWKNSYTPINPKKIFMLRTKTEIHTRNLITKKISAAQKFPTPHNFSNGPSLIDNKHNRPERRF